MRIGGGGSCAVPHLGVAMTLVSDKPPLEQADPSWAAHAGNAGPWNRGLQWASPCAQQGPSGLGRATEGSWGRHLSLRQNPMASALLSFIISTPLETIAFMAVAIETWLTLIGSHP